MIGLDYELTQEQRDKNRYHGEQWLIAMENGDEQTRKFHNSQILSDPDVLMASKRAFGAEFIRENKFNTTLADRKFGHGWLDK